MTTRRVFNDTWGLGLATAATTRMFSRLKGPADRLAQKAWKLWPRRKEQKHKTTVREEKVFLVVMVVMREMEKEVGQRLEYTAHRRLTVSLCTIGSTQHQRMHALE